MAETFVTLALHTPTLGKADTAFLGKKGPEIGREVMENSTAGRERIKNCSYFFPLTVFADVPDDARAMRDEPLGRLALTNPVGSRDEAIEKANALPYRLAAYAVCRLAFGSQC